MRHCPRALQARHRRALISNFSVVQRSPCQRPHPATPSVQRSGMASSVAVACQAAAVGAQRVAQRRVNRAAAVPAAAPARRRHQQRRLAVAATAAPPATGSPFAAVQNEEQLFGLLKAGASSGTVGAGGAVAPGCQRSDAWHGASILSGPPVLLRHVLAVLQAGWFSIPTNSNNPRRCLPASLMPSTSCTATTRWGI